MELSLNAVELHKHKPQMQQMFLGRSGLRSRYYVPSPNDLAESKR
jgi:hypothetical protein